MAPRALLGTCFWTCGRGAADETGTGRSPVMGHVAHEQSADLPGNIVKALVVPLARVCRATADQHFRPEVERLLLKLIVVNVSGLQRPATRFRLYTPRSCCQYCASQMSI